MSLLATIEDNLHEAIKSKNEEVVRTLRMLKSDIMYEKTKGTGDLPEDRVLEVIARACKKRKEAIHEYEKAGRADLAGIEIAELAIIERYLPEQLSEEEAVKLIDEKIAGMGAVSKKDFGRVMGVLMKELKGKVDGALVKKILTERLENL